MLSLSTSPDYNSIIILFHFTTPKYKLGLLYLVIPLMYTEGQSASPLMHARHPSVFERGHQEGIIQLCL